MKPGQVVRSGPGFLARLEGIFALDGVDVTSGLQGNLAAAAQGQATASELVEIGRAHEYGTDTIPMRPWLRTSSLRYTQDWVVAWRVALRAAARGETSERDRTLRLLGLQMKADIQATILDGPWFPLSPATVARRPKGDDTPLVDSGQMRQSVRSTVERPGRAPVLVA